MLLVNAVFNKPSRTRGDRAPNGCAGSRALVFRTRCCGAGGSPPGPAGQDAGGRAREEERRRLFRRNMLRREVANP